MADNVTPSNPLNQNDLDAIIKALSAGTTVAINLTNTLKEFMAYGAQVQQTQEELNKNTKEVADKLRRDPLGVKNMPQTGGAKANVAGDNLGKNVVKTMSDAVSKTYDEISREIRASRSLSFYSRNFIGQGLNNLTRAMGWFGIKGMEGASWDSETYKRWRDDVKGLEEKGQDKEAHKVKTHMALYEAKREASPWMAGAQLIRAGYHAVRGGESVLGGLLGVGGGLAGIAAGVAFNAALSQLTAVIKENTKALIGGHAADARLINAGAGNLGFSNSRLAIRTGDYRGYRTMMRRLGNRNDGDVAAALLAMSQGGIWGNSGMDAISAAVSKQAIKTRMGVDLKDSFISQLYRNVQGNRSGMFRNGIGAFNMNGMMMGIAAAVRNSQTIYGGQLGMNETISITEELTKGLLGMDNSVERVIGAIDSFGHAISSGKLTTEEFIGMFKGANEGMTQQQRLNVLALNPRGQGNILEQYYDFMKNSRDAEGKLSNWAYTARTILEMSKKLGGRNYKETTTLLSLDGSILDQLGFSQLKNNPNLLQILRDAARGDTGASAKLAEATRSDHDILVRQANLLDAIRNPVEHMRDALFAMAYGAWDHLNGSKAQYISSKMGMSADQKKQFEAAYVSDQAEDVGRKGVATETFKYIMESFGDNISTAMKTFMDQTYGMTAALEKNTKALNNNRNKLGA